MPLTDNDIDLSKAAETPVISVDHTDSFRDIAAAGRSSYLSYPLQLQLLLLCSHKGPTPPELTGFWSTLIAEQLTAFPNLDPAAAYLISHGVGHLVLPLLEAYLLIRIIQFASSQVGMCTNAAALAAASLTLSSRGNPGCSKPRLMGGTASGLRAGLGGLDAYPLIRIISSLHQASWAFNNSSSFPLGLIYPTQQGMLTKQLCDPSS